MEKKSIHALCEGAIMVALSAALSIPALRLWPEGGSMDLVMVPLIVFSLRYGVKWGLGTCVVYGFVDCLISGGLAWGWQAIILDYIVAYGLVGLAGLLQKKPVAAVMLASGARLAVHVLSGVILWGEYMPDVFLGMSMTNVWIYSLLYNGSFMVGNCAAAVIVVAVLAKSTKLLQPQLAAQSK